MGENSLISWTHHTFNPWIGCTKVSPGCAHCYAERDMDHRFGKVRWGKGQKRVRTSEANWLKPIAWHRACRDAGIRQRVFCASLADVFDPEVDPAWRMDLFALIDQCTSLDWLLLTKRPELIAGHLDQISNGTWKLGDRLPNVWLGTTVENQEQAEKRIPELLKIPARIRFLSCEPLLGPVDLDPAWCDECGGFESVPGLDGATPFCPDCPGMEGDGNEMSSPGWLDPDGIHWVIAGGESGPKARPMHPDWARSLRDQCQAAGVPFHFKQWGEWAPVPVAEPLSDKVYGHGPGFDGHVWRVGTKAAGRLLDGRTWYEVPA